MQCVLYRKEDYGSFSRRAFADFVDSLLIGISYFVLSSATGISTLVGALIFLLYMGGFKFKWHATPGYKLLDLRLVAINNQHLTLPQILVRTLSSAFSGLCFGLGFLWIAIDKNKQAWHDKIAGTYVVRSSAQPVDTIEAARETLIRGKAFVAISLAAVIAYVAFQQIPKRTEGYEAAQNYIRGNPLILRETGDITKIDLLSWWLQKQSGDAGQADFTFSVSGAKAKVNVNLQLRKAEGQWTITRTLFSYPAPEVRRLHSLAEQRNTDAQVRLGRIHLFGYGGKRDYGEAKKWLRVAADAGEPDAWAHLGVMYENGLGVTQDSEEASRLYRMGAEQGVAMAQNNLGSMYERGWGVARNYEEAVKWYRLAAEQGLSAAQHNLGRMYAEGLGVAQDPTEAVKYWRLAADQGLAVAQHRLGLFYVSRKDYISAHMWLASAAANGDKDAQKKLDMLTKMMTIEQVEEAKRRVRKGR